MGGARRMTLSEKLNLLRGLFCVYCSYLKNDEEEDDKDFLLLEIALMLRVIFTTFPSCRHLSTHSLLLSALFRRKSCSLL